MIDTKITVCNRALSLLKQGSISSLDENTFEAKQCKLLYEFTKAQVLSSQLWKHCVKVKTLNNHYIDKNLQKIEDYSYTFVLPENCLRILHVNEENNYLRQGRYLHVNTPEARVAYISNMELNEIPINIIYLIIIRLAAELSLILNVDQSLHKKFSDIYDSELKKASSLDSKEGYSIFHDDTIFESSWINSRF